MIGDFSRTSAVMPRVPLAGPSSGSALWLPSLAHFLAVEPRVKIATVHAYPLKHCAGSPAVSEAELLSRHVLQRPRRDGRALGLGRAWPRNPTAGG